MYNASRKNPLLLGSHPLGKGCPVCIVFEAGATHNGLESALKLVDMAAEAHADAIKFQMIHSARLIPDPSVMFTYKVLLDRATKRTETVEESLQTILKRRELPPEDWTALIRHCRERNILFFATASHQDEMAFLAEQGVDCVKIASGDITYHHLLRQAATYPWIVQIDTGNATIGEVEQAVDVLETAGCRRIIINHCPTGYPARLDGINLRVIQTLQTMFPYPIAFSDHTPGCTMDIAAVALGASILEKTISLDRTTRSPEHIMSLEPHEGAAFVQTIREVEQALGLRRRILQPQERANAAVARRSITAAHNLPEGHILVQEDLDYTRPETGIPACFDKQLLGRALRRTVQAGEHFSWSCLK